MDHRRALLPAHSGTDSAGGKMPGGSRMQGTPAVMSGVAGNRDAATVAVSVKEMGTLWEVLRDSEVERGDGAA